MTITPEMWLAGAERAEVYPAEQATTYVAGYRAYSLGILRLVLEHKGFQVVQESG